MSPRLVVVEAGVARINPPSAVMRLIGDGCACLLGSRDESVDLGTVLDEVAEAELAALQGEDQSAV